MNCEKCGHKTTTIDTKPSRSVGSRSRNTIQVMESMALDYVPPGKSGFRMRVRRCLECEHEFTTLELTEKQFTQVTVNLENIRGQHD